MLEETLRRAQYNGMCGGGGSVVSLITMIDS